MQYVSAMQLSHPYSLHFDRYSLHIRLYASVFFIGTTFISVPYFPRIRDVIISAVCVYSTFGYRSMAAPQLFQFFESS